MIRKFCLSILLLVLGSLVSAQDVAQQFIWEQANAQAAGASQPPEFLAAANSYNRLLQEGIVSVPLLMNLGSALVLGGDGINAGAAFERAERFMGANAESRQGLKAALALREGSQTVELPWSRTAFFWHYNLPVITRSYVALGGWVLLWLGILGHLPARRQAYVLWRNLAEATLVCGALLTLIFGASVTISLLDEAHVGATWEERVFASTSEIGG